MNEWLLFYIFILVSICITGYWIERVVTIIIESKMVKTEEFFDQLTTFFKTVYDYLTEDIENE
jgi:hypothetical protein